MFIHAVMPAIDILAEHFSSLDLKDVKRKCNKAFNMGWCQGIMQIHQSLSRPRPFYKADSHSH